MSKVVLDVTAVARLRSELGLSQRALAHESGITFGTISRLERGENHLDLTLRQVSRLVDALGTTVGSLIEAGPAQECQAHPEDAIVEAAIATAARAVTSTDLARALDWRLPRVTKAINVLEQRLAATGQRLHRTSVGYILRPRNLLTEAEIARIVRTAGLGRTTVSAMRLLRRALIAPLDDTWERGAGNADRVNRGMLERAGLLVRTDRGLEPSPAVRRSLRLAAGETLS